MDVCIHAGWHSENLVLLLRVCWGLQADEGTVNTCNTRVQQEQQVLLAHSASFFTSAAPPSVAAVLPRVITTRRVGPFRSDHHRLLLHLLTPYISSHLLHPAGGNTAGSIINWMVVKKLLVCSSENVHLLFERFIRSLLLEMFDMFLLNNVTDHNVS